MEGRPRQPDPHIPLAEAGPRDGHVLWSCGAWATRPTRGRGRNVSPTMPPSLTPGRDSAPPARPEASSASPCRDADAWTVAHDFAFHGGGAERVTSILTSEVAPETGMVYLGGDKSVVDRIRGARPAKALLPPWLVTSRSYRQLAPFYPVALGRLDPIPGNLIASSYAFSHHIPCTGAKVVYCHSPLRQIWSGEQLYSATASAPAGRALRVISPWLRSRDRAVARGATQYVATSAAVQARVAAFYGLADVPIVPPPVDTSIFRLAGDSKDREYFLWVGRIVEPYKRLELTLRAFDSLPYRLVVAGDGRDRERLMATAGGNVTFVGWQNDEQLAELYRGAAGLIFPSEDDFGIVPLESMACGAPVIAYRAGGAKDTVVEGRTGVFFDEPTAEALRHAVHACRDTPWSDRALHEHASSFGVGRFVREMRSVLQRALAGGTS